MPTVSVVIPTYNRADVLPNAIESVLNQTFQDFELIIVDDSPGDRINKLVKSYSDNRIRYIRNYRTKNVSGARNTGVANSKGKYIAFLDSDDRWLPKKLEKQLQILDTNREVGLVSAGEYGIARKGTVRVRMPKCRGDVHMDVLMGIDQTGGFSPIIAKKELLKSIGGFDEKLPAKEDWDLYIRLSRVCNFDFVEEPLVEKYGTNDSISKNMSGRDFCYERIRRKIDPEIQTLDWITQRKVLGQIEFNLGWEYLLNKQLSKARKQFIKSIKIYPLLLRSYTYLAITLVGYKGYKLLVHIKRLLDKAIHSESKSLNHPEKFGDKK